MKYTFDGILGLEKLIDRYPQEAYQITLLNKTECEIDLRPDRSPEEAAYLEDCKNKRAPFEKWFIGEHSPHDLGSRDCSIAWKAWQAALKYSAEDK